VSENERGALRYRIVDIHSWQLVERFFSALREGRKATFRATPLNVPEEALNATLEPVEFAVRVEGVHNETGHPISFDLEDDQFGWFQISLPGADTGAVEFDVIPA